MKITALVENQKYNKNFKAEHGLSLYIEACGHKILFDAGSNILFYNALKLHINVKEIDTIVISHGHIDHTAGLKKLLEVNKQAKVYILESAFSKYYVKILGMKFYVGIPKELENYKDRMVFVKDKEVIVKGLTIISDFKEKKCWSYANNRLLMKVGKAFICDDFKHEECLLISENGKNVLIGGCCHNGILNVLAKTDERNLKIQTVISGFHLMGLNVHDAKNSKLISTIAENLCQRDEMIYTCHCTGMPAYQKMKAIMKEKLEYLHSGEMIEI